MVFGVWLYFRVLFDFLYWIGVQTEVRVDENNIRLVSTPNDTEELLCVHGSAAAHCMYIITVYIYMGMVQDPVPLVNIKIAGK